MLERLCSKHVVLLGIGHTNAHVLRMWGMHSLADTDLTCISDHAIATYSGMLPAALAGQISQSEMEIDLVRLCASVGARLITDNVVGLDHERQLVRFEQRPPIPYDVLSVGIGSVPVTEGVAISGTSLVKVKPMQTFLTRLRNTVDLQRPPEVRPMSVVIVGGGAAGIEIAFCLPPFLKSLGIAQSQLHVISSAAEVLLESNPSARRRIRTELQSRNHTVTLGKSVKLIGNRTIELDDGTQIDADIVIWATGASPPPLLALLDLPLDERGFLATDRTLRSVSGRPVFAVGDSGTIQSESIPKAGVYAVRQGPILWDNIGRILHEQELRQYRPQRSFLKLINKGDGDAIGLWRGLSFSGRWVKLLKDHIDKKFIRMFEPRAMEDVSEPMQCRGCGAKMGAIALKSAINTALCSDANEGAGEIAIEDAVEIGSEAGRPLIASTDFFTSPFHDAFLNGRIAALHSASDIVATGARATKALAIVVLQEGDRPSQQRSLSDFLVGARHEFDAMGARIVGGHTIIGPRMEIGFTVVGQAYSQQLLQKSNLKPDDQLFLTKPLGIGALLAAHMRGRCQAIDHMRLIDAMLGKQHDFARIAIESGIVAATDVTGFGLAGHLLEMLSASKVAATLFLDAIPFLSGAVETVQAGIESSLIEENLLAEERIDALATVRATPMFRLLFDPQTCGGFLFGCPGNLCQQFIRRIQENGLPEPYWIGQCQKPAAELPLRVEMCRS